MGKQGEKLRPEISILIDYDIYCFAVMEPAPFIYYKCFVCSFRCKNNLRLSVMYNQKIGDFLVEFAKKAKQSRNNVSFLAVFVIS